MSDIQDLLPPRSKGKYGWDQQPGQAKYEDLERDISRIEEILGRKPLGGQITPGTRRTENDLSARLKYYGALRSKLGSTGYDVDAKTTDGFPMTEKGWNSALTGGPKTQFGERFGFMQDPGLTYIKSAPAGVTADQKPKTEEPKPTMGPSEGPKKYTTERVTPEGFLSADQRKELKSQMAANLMAGRDASQDKKRKMILMGQGLGKAITGAWSGGSGQLGRTSRFIHNQINQDMAATSAEFDRPEAQRKARMAELLSGIGDDSELGALFRKRSLPTYAVDGQMADPDMAGRNPEGFLQADSQETARLDPELATLANRSRALEYGMSQSKQEFDQQLELAKLSKLRSEIAVNTSKANENANDEEAAILASEMEADAMQKADNMRTGWFTSKKIPPEKMPLGLDRNGAPDKDLLMALAKRRIAQRDQPQQ